MKKHKNFCATVNVGNFHGSWRYLPLLIQSNTLRGLKLACRRFVDSRKASQYLFEPAKESKMLFDSFIYEKREYYQSIFDFSNSPEPINELPF